MKNDSSISTNLKATTNTSWIYRKLSSNGANPGSSLSLKQQSLSPIDSVLAVASSLQDLQRIQNDSRVVSIENNCLVDLMGIIPNDPDFSKSWALSLIQAPGAWQILHDSSVIVAVPDTGVDIQHKDLKDNIWINQKEAAGQSGIDDDGNGYVDDIYGWAFAEKNADVTPGTYKGADHGTHVAGILGSAGNNGYGTSGVAWKTKIMVLRPFQKLAESATTADLIESIYYAVNNGAQIINCSWGAQQTPTKAEIDAYTYAETHDVFVVGAAGNDTQDVALYSPASLSTVFAVGSINSQKELSTFSNYGEKIGVLAPGGDSITSFGVGRDEGVYSTVPGDGFDIKKGTSSSAPFVSGVVSLVRTLVPQMKPREIRRLLQETGEKVSIRTGGNFNSYSILNADRAISVAKEVSISQPNCRENCVFTGGGSFENRASPAASKFGGGCEFRAPLNLEGTKSASTNWDIALLICYLFPIGRLTALGKVKNRSKQ